MQNNFEHIYHLAVDNKIDKLIALIQDGGCIDERQIGTTNLSAGALLAEQGHFTAATLLLEVGANANLIAHGAAKGGHKNFVNLVKTQYNADDNWIAQGTAEGGFQGASDDLLLNNANINWIARGAALGGHRQHVLNLSKQNANSAWIFRGYFLGGQDAFGIYRSDPSLQIEAKLFIEIQEFATAVRGEKGLLSDLDLAALGAAVGGHLELAEFYRTQHNISVHIIAAGAAFTGHKSYTEFLRIQHGADINVIAYNAAKGGNQNYAQWLLENHSEVSVDLMAQWSALGGHRNFAEFLRMQFGANDRNVAKGAALSGDINYCEFLRTLPNVDLTSLATWSAQGGNRVYAEQLRENNNLPATEIAKGAIIGGDIRYAEFLRANCNVNIDDVAETAAYIGYDHYADYLRIEFKADINKIAKAAREGGHLKYAMDLEDLINNSREITPERNAASPLDQSQSPQLESETVHIKLEKRSSPQLHSISRKRQASTNKFFPSSVDISGITKPDTSASETSEGTSPCYTSPNN